jgi:periplasmic mercuric ion binding protein
MKIKSLIKKTAVTLFMVIATVAFGFSQTQEIIIQTTAQCGECKTNIEKALMAEKGVRFAELDVKSKQAKVVYNTKKTTPEQLRKTIALAGYDADDVPADSAAVLRLNPCCTKDGHRE